jgi:hypothetical protein
MSLLGSHYFHFEIFSMYVKSVLYMPSSSGVLISAIKQEAKYSCCSDTLLFYIQQKSDLNCSSLLAYFPKMNVGLSDHQRERERERVCVCLSVRPSAPPLQ